MRLFFILIFFLFLMGSCSKCDPTNKIGGEVVEDVVVRIIDAWIEEPILVTNPFQLDNYSQTFHPAAEMRLNSELEYIPVDFSKYSIVGVPTTASCSSGYERIIDFDDFNNVVHYTINITECPTCDGTMTIQNWVLIPRVASDYIVEVDINYQ